VSGEQPEPDDNRGHNNLLVALAVIVLLVIAWIVIQKYAANQRMENCRIEGRRDCDAIPIPPRQ
jgi:hypothetical protein